MAARVMHVMTVGRCEPDEVGRVRGMEMVDKRSVSGV